MHLRNGENGLVEPRSNKPERAHKLFLFFDNDALRRRFPKTATREIAENDYTILTSCAPGLGPHSATQPVKTGIKH
jgi:hypothetical protein